MSMLGLIAFVDAASKDQTYTTYEVGSRFANLTLFIFLEVMVCIVVYNVYRPRVLEGVKYEAICPDESDLSIIYSYASGSLLPSSRESQTSSSDLYTVVTQEDETSVQSNSDLLFVSGHRQESALRKLESGTGGMRLSIASDSAQAQLMCQFLQPERRNSNSITKIKFD